MKCYEIQTANTTYYARVSPGRVCVAPGRMFAEPDTVTVYGGRFGLIDAHSLPVPGTSIYGESSGRRVRTSPVVSVRRISRKRFLQEVV